MIAIALLLVILFALVGWVNFKINRLASGKVLYPDGKTPYFTQLLCSPTVYRCKRCGEKCGH